MSAEKVREFYRRQGEERAIKLALLISQQKEPTTLTDRVRTCLI